MVFAQISPAETPHSRRRSRFGFHTNPGATVGGYQSLPESRTYCFSGNQNQHAWIESFCGNRMQRKS
jgi:hypothetical protein